MWPHIALSVVTAATSEPVTVDEFKLHARISVDSEENALLESYLKAARKFCETHTRRAFITQTWRLSLDCFPCVIHVPMPPLQSVSSIAYIDSAGDSQTLASSAYQVDTYTEPGRIREAYGYTWPATRTQSNAVTVQFVAGYGAASAVPDTIKTAIKLVAASLYRNRESVGEVQLQHVPHGALTLLGVESWGSYV